MPRKTNDALRSRLLKNHHDNVVVLVFEGGECFLKKGNFPLGGLTTTQKANLAEKIAEKIGEI